MSLNINSNNSFDPNVPEQIHPTIETVPMSLQTSELPPKTTASTSYALQSTTSPTFSAPTASPPETKETPSPEPNPQSPNSSNLKGSLLDTENSSASSANENLPKSTKISKESLSVFSYVRSGCLKAVVYVSSFGVVSKLFYAYPKYSVFCFLLFLLIAKAKNAPTPSNLLAPYYGKPSGSCSHGNSAFCSHCSWDKLTRRCKHGNMLFCSQCKDIKKM